MVGGGRVEAAALGVVEALDRRLRQRAGLGEPALFEGRFVEGQQCLEQEGVVLEVGVEVGAAVLVSAQEVAVGVARLAEEEAGALAGGVEVVIPSQHRAGVGQRRDRQRVPGG